MPDIIETANLSRREAIGPYGLWVLSGVALVLFFLSLAGGVYPLAVGAVGVVTGLSLSGSV